MTREPGTAGAGAGAEVAGREDEGANVYDNVVIGATPNPVMLDPDDIDEAFAQAANEVLRDAVEVLRHVVPSHQAAVALVVDGDFASTRKFFSLSPKYAAWAQYRVPAVGLGIHRWVLDEKLPVRLTQHQLETHPPGSGSARNATGTLPCGAGWRHPCSTPPAPAGGWCSCRIGSPVTTPRPLNRRRHRNPLRRAGDPTFPGNP